MSWVAVVTVWIIHIIGDNDLLTRERSTVLFIIIRMDSWYRLVLVVIIIMIVIVIIIVFLVYYYFKHQELYEGLFSYQPCWVGLILWLLYPHSHCYFLSPNSHSLVFLTLWFPLVFDLFNFNVFFFYYLFLITAENMVPPCGPNRLPWPQRPIVKRVGCIPAHGVRV